MTSAYLCDTFAPKDSHHRPPKDSHLTMGNQKADDWMYNRWRHDLVITIVLERLSWTTSSESATCERRLQQRAREQNRIMIMTFRHEESLEKQKRKQQQAGGDYLGMLKAWLIPVVATLNVPPYSMLLWFILYVGLVVTTTSVVRSILLGYWAYCILETSTCQASKATRWIQTWQPYLSDLWFVHWTAEYLQTQLVKTVDLPPSQGPYIFAYHPHGVIGMGASLALTTNGCYFTKTFPGIQRSCATLNVTFWAPFYRHWMLWLGCCSVNKRTLVGRLENGVSLVLIPGGAVEALHAHPQTMVLKRRQGFVKLAKETSAKVVPVIGFGENDVFDTIYHGKELFEQDLAAAENTASRDQQKQRHTLLWKLQHALYKKMTFSIPLWFHVVPKRSVPLTVVVGAPVEFPAKATLEQCNDLYWQAVRELYETHKIRYGYKDVPLVFI